MLMAKVVTDLANRTPGKEAVAMESFAKALRMVQSHLPVLFIESSCGFSLLSPSSKNPVIFSRSDSFQATEKLLRFSLFLRSFSED